MVDDAAQAFTDEVSLRAEARLSAGPELSASRPTAAWARGDVGLRSGTSALSLPVGKPLSTKESWTMATLACRSSTSSRSYVGSTAQSPSRECCPGKSVRDGDKQDA